MNPDVQILVSIWETVRTFIPKKDRIEAAENLVRVMDEELDLVGIEDELQSFDAVLKAAAKSHFGDDEDDDQDDFDWE
jgi:hypothetical protein